jgi:plasmid stabilization system protein ParE
VKRRRVAFHEDFRDDVRGQIDRLIANDREEWIPLLRTAIVEAAELLEAFPSAGTRAPRPSLYKLVLRKVPFVVWYGFEPSNEEIVVLRLFHSRQRRPR